MKMTGKRKTIVSLLSVAMMLSSTVFASGNLANITTDDYTVDILNVEYETDTIKALKEYGIIQGYDNGELKPDDFITRSEVATIVCRLLCLDIITEKSYFTDVTDDFWGKDYINTALKNGIIHGYDNMTFKPNENITYAEISKIIVSCLGYAPIAEIKEGFPYGYIAIANSFDLIPNYSQNPNEVIKRGEVFDMIYASLNIPIAVQEDYGDKRILIMDGRYDDCPLTTLRMKHKLTIEK